MFKHSASRYTVVALALHWAIAALILFMIWLGWNMDENEARYQLHKSIGITILLLTVARVVWRMLNPPPALPAGMKPLETTASHYVHLGLYALMILIPLFGWALVSASKFQVPTILFGAVSWPHLPFLAGLRSNELAQTIIETFHSKGAWVIIALLALHVAGALKHEFSAEEGVLKRMIPGLFGKTRPPAAPARGFFVAFGSAALLFAIVAAAPLVAQSRAAGENAPSLPGPEAALATSQIAAEPNWTVDYAKSEIRFSGTHDGNTFSGTFKGWTAEVAFFPDAVETSDVRVRVETATATTGKKLYDDSLRAPEWFDVSHHPVATVHLTDFTKTETGYAAMASMRLKNLTVATALTFSLDINGDVATLNGEARFDRKALLIGQISDPNAEWVSDEVTVTVTGEASRK